MNWCYEWYGWMNYTMIPSAIIMNIGKSWSLSGNMKLFLGSLPVCMQQTILLLFHENRFVNLYRHFRSSFVHVVFGFQMQFSVCMLKNHLNDINEALQAAVQLQFASCILWNWYFRFFFFFSPLRVTSTSNTSPSSDGTTDGIFYFYENLLGKKLKTELNSEDAKRCGYVWIVHIERAITSDFPFDRSHFEQIHFCVFSFPSQKIENTCKRHIFLVGADTTHIYWHLPMPNRLFP